MGAERTKEWRAQNPERHRVLQREANRRYRARRRVLREVIAVLATEAVGSITEEDYA